MIFWFLNGFFLLCLWLGLAIKATKAAPENFLPLTFPVARGSSLERDPSDRHAWRNSKIALENPSLVYERSQINRRWPTRSAPARLPGIIPRSSKYPSTLALRAAKHSQVATGLEVSDKIPPPQEPINFAGESVKIRLRRITEPNNFPIPVDESLLNGRLLASPDRYYIHVPNYLLTMITKQEQWKDSNSASRNSSPADDSDQAVVDSSFNKNESQTGKEDFYTASTESIEVADHETDYSSIDDSLMKYLPPKSLPIPPAEKYRIGPQGEVIDIMEETLPLSSGFSLTNLYLSNTNNFPLLNNNKVQQESPGMAHFNPTTPKPNRRHPNKNVRIPNQQYWREIQNVQKPTPLVSQLQRDPSYELVPVDHSISKKTEHANFGPSLPHQLYILENPQYEVTEKPTPDFEDSESKAIQDYLMSIPELPQGKVHNFSSVPAEYDTDDYATAQMMLILSCKGEEFAITEKEAMYVACCGVRAYNFRKMACHRGRIVSKKVVANMEPTLPTPVSLQFGIRHMTPAQPQQQTLQIIYAPHTDLRTHFQKIVQKSSNGKMAPSISDVCDPESVTDEFCCSDRLHPRIEGQVCCHNSVYAYFPNGLGACCGFKPFNSKTHVCLDGDEIGAKVI